MKMPAVCIVLVAVMLVGCKGHSIVGKWTATSKTKDGNVTMNFEFSDPDKLAAIVEAPGGVAKIHIVGTFKLDGDQMTTLATDCTVEASGPQAATIKALLEGQKKDFLKDLNKDPTGKITWDGNDRFKVATTTKGEEVTFTRVK